MRRNVVAVWLAVLAAGVAMAAPASAAAAAECVQELYWDALQASGALRAGTVEPAEGDPSAARLRLSSDGAGAVTFMVIDEPRVTRAVYALVGRVRTENVEGSAYLEMWSHFPGGGRYFSRTLGEDGPLADLGGTQARRRFVLPFYNKADAPPPERLTVSVVFAGPGTVYLDSVRLMQYAAGEDPLAGPRAWWSDRTGGLVGGIGGGLLGVLGGLVGVLAGLGRARRFVLATMKTVAVLGGVALAAGVAAIAAGQPYGVWYPLVLGGALAALLFAGLQRAVRARYDQVELRRIEALDAS